MRSKQPSRADDSASSDSAASPPIEIDVARTGGFAGITRRWTAQPPEDEASEWISLIDRCPWDEVTPPKDDRKAVRGAVPHAAPPRQPVPDGFVWWIRASWSGEPAGPSTREAELPDDAVTGAWRELIDAVRDWNRATSNP
jgi:hypothetical protein